MMKSRLPAQITLALALASILALGGCASDGSTPGGTPPQSDASQPDASPSDAGSSGAGQGEQATSDFPGEIPVVDGTVTYSNASDNPNGKKWTLELAVDDHLAAAAEARRLLTAEGFAEDSWNQSDTQAQGAFISGTYHVTVSAPGDSDGTILYEAILR